MIYYFICIFIVFGIVLIMFYGDISCDIKRYFAKKNIEKYNNKLVHDKNENVRAEVAKYCDKNIFIINCNYCFICNFFSRKTSKESLQLL